MSRAWPGVVFLLHSAPRTYNEIRALTGSDVQAIYPAVQALVEEGLVEEVAGGRRESKFGDPSKLWRWVPKEGAS